jgi:DNA-directed RNA polymerase specialized sigma subunit
MQPVEEGGNTIDVLNLIDYSVLNHTERELINYYRKGYRLKDIAKILSIKYNTVTPMYSKAVIKLRKDLINRGIIERQSNTSLAKPRIYKKK